MNIIKKIYNKFFKEDEEFQYWSYSGGRMYATDEAIEKTKEVSLKTYNDFIQGNFDLKEVLPQELYEKVMNEGYGE